MTSATDNSIFRDGFVKRTASIDVFSEAFDALQLSFKLLFKDGCGNATASRNTFLGVVLVLKLPLEIGSQVGPFPI